jgi:hypothetical protein
VCGGATGGNFSPVVAACGTFVTDLPTSPWGGRDRRDRRDERCQSGQRPVGLPRAAPHQVTGDVAEVPPHRCPLGTGRRDHYDYKRDLGTAVCGPAPTPMSLHDAVVNPTSENAERREVFECLLLVPTTSCQHQNPAPGSRAVPSPSSQARWDSTPCDFLGCALVACALLWCAAPPAWCGSPVVGTGRGREYSPARCEHADLGE